MKVLVTYLSQTGNTKKVAEAVFSEIQCEKEIREIEEVSTLDGYDLAFVGFPVWQFGPAEPARKFIEARAAGKNIALFVTHAMPSDSEDRQMRDKLDEILERCRACGGKANLVDFFECQGELSVTIADFLLKNSDPTFQQFGRMRPMTLGHPDADDLAKARAFTAEVMKNFKP